MTLKTINNNDSIGKTPDLTPREQEILNMILSGIVPKEIAFNLKISYDTVLYHQRNLYRKLEVQSIQELFVKYLKQNESLPAMSRKLKSNVTDDCYFARIEKTNDDFGSEIFFKVEDEIIAEPSKRTYAFFGHLVSKHRCYATIFMIPHPPILAAMKKIKSFSFSAMGDGSSFGVMLLTNDTMQEGEYNNYHYLFKTEKGVISEYNVNLDDLVQFTTWGKQVPFIKDNIMELGFFPHSFGDFELKVWDIKFIE